MLWRRLTPLFGSHVRCSSADCIVPLETFAVRRASVTLCLCSRVHKDFTVLRGCFSAVSVRRPPTPSNLLPQQILEYCPKMGRAAKFSTTLQISQVACTR